MNLKAKDHLNFQMHLVVQEVLEAIAHRTVALKIAKISLIIIRIYIIIF